MTKIPVSHQNNVLINLIGLEGGDAAHLSFFECCT